LLAIADCLIPIALLSKDIDMLSYLVAGPASEPVTLAQARAFLRLDDTAEDGLLTTLVAAARIHLESITGRALLSQTWRLVLDDWPTGGVVTLPVSPLLSLASITAYDEEGEAHTVPLAQFEAESRVTPARLLLPPTVDGIPAAPRARLGIEVDYVAGFGEDADDLPAPMLGMSSASTRSKPIRLERAPGAVPGDHR
jgi:uncharacterized phiE125 gp8 family phage protein